MKDRTEMSKHRFLEFSEQARSRGQALRQNTELEELVATDESMS